MLFFSFSFQNYPRHFVISEILPLSSGEYYISQLRYESCKFVYRDTIRTARRRVILLRQDTNGKKKNTEGRNGGNVRKNVRA